MTEIQFSVSIDWDEGFQFTDEQWAKIIDSFGDVPIGENIRHRLCQLAWTHVVRRRQPPGIPLSRQRKRLERIAKASAALRDAIQDRQGMLEDWELARTLTGCDFKSMPDLKTLFQTWYDFECSLDSLHKKAEQRVLECEMAKLMPANVDEVRNGTLEELAEIYEELTCKPPKPRVGINEHNEGIAYGPFVDFVIAFMEALPGDERVTPDQINHFLRRRNAKGDQL